MVVAASVTPAMEQFLVRWLALLHWLHVVDLRVVEVCPVGKFPDPERIRGCRIHL